MMSIASYYRPDQTLEYHNNSQILTKGYVSEYMMEIVSGSAYIDINYVNEDKQKQMKDTYMRKYKSGDIINYVQCCWNVPNLKTVRSYGKCKIRKIYQYRTIIQNKKMGSSWDAILHSLGIFKVEDVIKQQLMQHAQYKCIEKGTQIKLQRNVVYILYGSYTHEVGPSKIKRSIQMQQCYPLQIKQQGLNKLLTTSTNNCKLITISTHLLSQFLPQKHFNKHMSQFIKNAQLLFKPKKPKKQPRSKSMNNLKQEPRTQLIQIFDQPARKRYYSHWLKIKTNAIHHRQQNTRSFHQFKKSIMNRYMKKKIYEGKIRNMVENKIYEQSTELRKKRLKNDPLSLIRSHKQLFKKKVGNSQHIIKTMNNTHNIVIENI